MLLLLQVLAYVSTSVSVEKFGTQVADFLQTSGMVTNATLAKAAGGAIVGSALNGTIAAATGGNVKEAMATGAVGGGCA
jgi:hypothetical protein